jgi:hypothetical protein
MGRRGKSSEPELGPAAGAIRRAEEASEFAEKLNRQKAEQRLVVERGLRIDRADLAYKALGQNALRRRNTVGVVALQGANPNYFLQGLEENAQKNRGSVLRFPADTRGERGVAQIIEQMTELQLSDEERGLKVVVFEGVDYREPEGGASPEVTKIISEIAASCIVTNVQYEGLSLMVVGAGELANLPGSTQYNPRNQPPFAENLSIMFALDKDNELSSAPEAGEPTRVTTQKPFSPANAARANYPAIADPFTH